jgi:hypothetical protein
LCFAGGVIVGLSSWLLDESQQEPEAALSMIQPPDLSIWLQDAVRPGSGSQCPLLEDLMEVAERHDWDTCEERGDTQLRVLTLLILLTLLKHTGLLAPILNKQM